MSKTWNTPGPTEANRPLASGAMQRLCGTLAAGATASLCVGPCLSQEALSLAPKDLVLDPYAHLVSTLSVGEVLVEVNTASQAELESVAGVGPALSTRLLAARALGPFTDWADFVVRVKGVGWHGAQRLSRSGLRVDGKSHPADTLSERPIWTHGLLPTGGSAPEVRWFLP